HGNGLSVTSGLPKLAPMGIHNIIILTMSLKQIPHPALFVLLAIVVSCTTGTEEPPHSYSLSTAASPAEGGKITVSPASGAYTEGQTVTLKPEPSPNWVFEQWEGDASGSSSPLTLTMNANK